MSRFLDRCNALFQVRPGEWPRVAVFGSYLGLLVANLIIINSFNDAAFLSANPVSLLPYLFMASSAAL
ncbi:MAG TPA: hypothetical protein ENJ73_01915, partial [Desulfobacterales bacterium]|nr:hypothetical protein [Desulfobacterales bacterium]